METSNSIFDKMMFVEEHTVGFAPSIKAAKERATPAYIDSFVEKTEDEGKHGYIECMPKTLHIASAIIWLLPNIRNLVGNTAILVMDFWQECYGQQPTYNNLFRETTLKKDYRSLFSSDEDARTCLLLMNHFGLIHTDGAHRIGDRAKYNLLAFVEALQKKDLLPSTQIIEKITATLADQISLQYPRPRKDKVEEYKYNECLRIHLGKINEIDTGRITWPTVNQWLADDGR